MDSGQEILPIVEIEGEAEIFLKILVELVIKEPEEIESLIKKKSDVTDGPALDAIILVVAKLKDLLKRDIDSLNIPSPLKISLKILKNFLDFISQSKLLYALKYAKNKKHAAKKRKANEECGENISCNQ